VMMGTDLTNSVPGTFRKSIAGEPQRLHTDLLMREFYPFDTYAMRYFLFIRAVTGNQWDVAPGPTNQNATCEPNPTFVTFSRERAYDYYGPGAPQRVYVDYNVKLINDIAAVAKSNGAKTYIILLPDPAGLLAPNRSYYAGAKMDWDWSRTTMMQKLGRSWPTLDMGAAFLGKPEYFKCGDEHWNDAGNVLGAQLAAGFLTQQLRNAQGG
jgi:hypothetical protein